MPLAAGPFFMSAKLVPNHTGRRDGPMATKAFAINTEPHVADVGGTLLRFQAEVIGAEFAQAYAELRTIQQRVKGTKASSTKHAKDESLDPEVLVDLHKGMRKFVRGFLLEESQASFDSLRLPDRILVQLMEWVAELYGSGASGDDDQDGGKADAPGGQSSDS